MGSKEPRLSAQTLKILGFLMSQTSTEVSGADVGRVTRLPSGTVYPILLRLEEAQWIESRWEDEDPHLLGRPRRRLYQMTGVGVRKARRAFKDITFSLGALAWR